MPATILLPCRVPWAISPSMSGLTLWHQESSTQPECVIILGAGRLGDDGRTDSRRIEISFDSCYHVRVGEHSDQTDVETLGYSIASAIECAPADYLELRSAKWRADGVCPDSGFYVAQQSAWLAGYPHLLQEGSRHYIIDGRDGYIELIARRY